MNETDPILRNQYLDPIRSYRVGSGSPMWVPGYLGSNLPKLAYDTLMDRRASSQRAVGRANDDVLRQAWAQQYEQEQQSKKQFFLDFEKQERLRAAQERQMRLQEDAQRRFPAVPPPQNPFDNMQNMKFQLQPGDPIPDLLKPNWSDRKMSYRTQQQSPLWHALYS